MILRKKIQNVVEYVLSDIDILGEKMKSILYTIRYFTATQNSAHAYVEGKNKTRGQINATKISTDALTCNIINTTF